MFLNIFTFNISTPGTCTSEKTYLRKCQGAPSPRQLHLWQPGPLNSLQRHLLCPAEFPSTQFTALDPHSQPSRINTPPKAILQFHMSLQMPTGAPLQTSGGWAIVWPHFMPRQHKGAAPFSQTSFCPYKASRISPCCICGAFWAARSVLALETHAPLSPASPHVTGSELSWLFIPLASCLHCLPGLHFVIFFSSGCVCICVCVCMLHFHTMFISSKAAWPSVLHMLLF